MYGTFTLYGTLYGCSTLTSFMTGTSMILTSGTFCVWCLWWVWWGYSALITTLKGLENEHKASIARNVIQASFLCSSLTCDVRHHLRLEPTPSCTSIRLQRPKPDREGKSFRVTHDIHQARSLSTHNSLWLRKSFSNYCAAPLSMWTVCVLFELWPLIPAMRVIYIAQ